MKPKTIVWAFAISWLFSALMHSVDPDVGGVAGLWNPLVLVSVSLLALVVLVPASVCLFAYLRRHWRGYLVALAIFSTIMGTIMALLGAGGIGSASWLLAFTGSALIFGLFLVAASLPMIKGIQRSNR